MAYTLEYLSSKSNSIRQYFSILALCTSFIFFIIVVSWMILPSAQVEWSFSSKSSSIMFSVVFFFIVTSQHLSRASIPDITWEY